MKLYLSAPGFRWGGSIPLTDAGGRPRYHLLGEAYSLGRRIHLMDLAGREALSVRQVHPSLLPRYDLEVYGKPLGQLTGTLPPDAPAYRLSPAAWTIPEAATRRDLRLLDGETVLGTCVRDPEDGTHLTFTVPDRDRTLPVLAVLLTVHCILPK